jgi:hypothetical protein
MKAPKVRKCWLERKSENSTVKNTVNGQAGKWRRRVFWGRTFPAAELNAQSIRKASGGDGFSLSHWSRARGRAREKAGRNNQANFDQIDSVAGRSDDRRGVRRERLGGNRRQRLAEKSQPVLVEDPVDVGIPITPGGKKAGQLLQVGNRVQVVGRLLDAEAAIQVAADGAMFRTAGKLADVVDVIDDR